MINLLYLLTTQGDTNICTQPVVEAITKFAGTAIGIIRWAVPILLIVYGSIDLGRAIMEKEEKKIKEGYSKLAKKFGVAVVVFLIPSLLMWILAAFKVGEGSPIETGGTDANDCLKNIFPGYEDLLPKGNG